MYSGACWVFLMVIVCFKHCIKIARIRIYSGPCFPAFGLSTERCFVSPYLSVFFLNARKSGPEYLQIRSIFRQWKWHTAETNQRRTCENILSFIRLVSIYTPENIRRLLIFPLFSGVKNETGAIKWINKPLTEKSHLQF